MVFLRRLLSPVVTFCFIFQSFPIYGAQASLLNLPEPGKMISLSPKFVPAYVKGISIYPNDPFKFDFIIDTGDTKLNDQQFKEESNRLIKYFMAALTVPEKEDWVNLSPYEKDRIVPESLGVTEMGRDMLAQDYILKQLTSSLIYPEKAIGKEFWSKVYAQAQKQFGTTDIPVNTFNKVWIVPSQAVVWEHGNSAYVVRSHLKVMLEQDYLSLNKHLNNNIFSGSGMDRQDAQATNAVGSNVVREVVLPALEKEVNEGANFATLRQVFNSAILAAWYKKNLQQSILGQVYADKNKVTGVDLADKQIKQKIYERYLQAFKKGAFNFIKEDNDPVTHQIVPRKYFSGGEFFGDLAQVTQTLDGDLLNQSPEVQNAVLAAGHQVGDAIVELVPEAGANASQAMLAEPGSFEAAVQTPRKPVVEYNLKGELYLEGLDKVLEGIASNFVANPTGANKVDVIVYPSFIHLEHARKTIDQLVKKYKGALPKGFIKLGVQNIRKQDMGPYTGHAPSIKEILDLGVEAVLLGHSEISTTERGETTYVESDELIAEKARAVINANAKRREEGKSTLLLTIAYGEETAERGPEKSVAAWNRQLNKRFGDLTDKEIMENGVVAAYEPVWSIGVGKKPATTKEALEGIAFGRRFFFNKFGAEGFGVASTMRFLHGGNVSKDNVSDLAAEDEIDGGLVGGASKTADTAIPIWRTFAQKNAGNVDLAMLAPFQEASISGISIPDALKKLGLTLSGIQIATLKGEGAETLLNDVLFQSAWSVSIGQALGAILLAGQGTKAKEVADANAVRIGHKILVDIVKSNPKIAFASIGSEGIRDGSVGTPLGRIYHNSFENGYYNSTDLNDYVAHVEALRAQGVQILYFRDDGLENTNALKDNKKDAWSVTSFEYDDPTKPVRYLLDEKRLRRLSTVTNAPKDAGIEITDSPRQILTKLAAAHGIKDLNTEEGRAFAKQVGFAVLGARAAGNEKESGNQRHSFYIDEIYQLADKEKGYGVQPIIFGDGDLMPGLLAASGIDLGDGLKYLVKVGRSGLVEGEILDLGVGLMQGAQAASRYVSNEKTAKSVTPETMMGQVEDGLEQDLVEKFGFLHNTLSTVSTQNDFIGRKGVIALTADTGADETRYGNNFAEQMPRLTFNNDGTVTANTFLMTNQGVFVIRATLKAEDALATKLAILNASKEAQEYVAANENKFDFIQSAKAQRQAASAIGFILSVGQKNNLRTIVSQIASATTGFLAADGSTGTANKSIAGAMGLSVKDFEAKFSKEQQLALRQDFRRLTLTSAALPYTVGGVILYDEAVKYVDANGHNLVMDYVIGRGVGVVHKTDRGLDDDADSPIPSEGIDREKVSKPEALGQANLNKILGVFPNSVATKFRITVSIDEKTGLPTEANILKIVDQLAQHAYETQKAGRVPTVEPEILINGPHSIDVSYQVALRVYKAMFDALRRRGVYLPGVILKPSMVISGNKAENRAGFEEVAKKTIQALMASVPAELGAILFLSGGQSTEEALGNLNAIAKEAKAQNAPWRLAYSFSRAFKSPAVKLWAGKAENIPAAQKVFNQTLYRGQAASLGVLEEFDALMARIGIDRLLERQEAYNDMLVANAKSDNLGKLVSSFDKVRVAVNGGGGRVGLNLLLANLESSYDMDIVALNDVDFIGIKKQQDLDDFIRILRDEFSQSKVESVHHAKIDSGKGDDGYWWIAINGGEKIRLISESDPSKLPWKTMNIDVVYEATGRFTNPEKAALHLKAGAKKVVISAPSTNEVTTIVAGVNTEMLKSSDNICSAGSCTTGSIAPPLYVIAKKFGIVNFYMVTIHAYTNDQALQKRFRPGAQQRGMPANQIIPTSTGAAKAIGLVLPHLLGKGDGVAYRVPVIDGSVSNIDIIVEKDVTVEEINEALREAANDPLQLKDVMAVEEGDLVSTEILKRPESAIIQLNATKVLGKRRVIIRSWYDNEVGFSHRALDLGAAWTGARERKSAQLENYRRSIPGAIQNHINTQQAIGSILSVGQKNNLRTIVSQIASATTGFLAADGSTGTANKSIAGAMGLSVKDFEAKFSKEQQLALRQDFRRLTLTSAALPYTVGGVILYDEAVKYVDANGHNLVMDYVIGRGVGVVHKTDRGLDDDADSPIPSEGIDREKVSKPEALGQANLNKILGVFPNSVATKFRITVSIDEKTGLPTEANILKIVDQLAQHAYETQKAGRVPTVEPEILINGPHSIDVSYQVALRVYKAMFDALRRRGVYLPGVILKPSMVISGNKAENRAGFEEVAKKTIQALMASVPAELGAILFLSGGQSTEEALGNLNAIAKEAKAQNAPWRLAYSFSRAFKSPAVKLWAGKAENIPAAQKVFNQTLYRGQAASLGVLEEFDALMARIGIDRLLERQEAYNDMLVANAKSDNLGKLVSSFDIDAAQAANTAQVSADKEVVFYNLTELRQAVASRGIDSDRDRVTSTEWSMDGFNGKDVVNQSVRDYLGPYSNYDTSITKIRVLKGDPAALANNPHPKHSVEGGINLDSGLYNMQVLRDGNGRLLPVSQQPIGRFMQIKGFRPVFINIERNINLPARLGVNLNRLPKEQFAQASSVNG